MLAIPEVLLRAPHQLSAQPPITVKTSTFTTPLSPRSLISYDIRS